MDSGNPAAPLRALSAGLAVLVLCLGALCVEQAVELRRLRMVVAADDRRAAVEAARVHAVEEENTRLSHAVQAAAVKRQNRASGGVAGSAAHSAAAPRLTPVLQLGNVGRGTPRDAFATQLWASRHGDIDDAANTITFTPEGRKILEQAAAKLPADLAAQYNTPEKLMAYALAGSPHPVGGMQVLSETPQPDGTVLVQADWQHEDDEIVHHSALVFRQDDGGWKQVMPDALVERVAAYLTRGH